MWCKMRTNICQPGILSNHYLWYETVKAVLSTFENNIRLRGATIRIISDCSIAEIKNKKSDNLQAY
jgi:hypothetical protein